MRAGAAALLAGALLVAACGTGGGPGSGQPAGSIKVTMTEFKFDPSSISVPSGKVVFFLVNGGALSHDMIISDGSNNRVAGSELVSAGDSFIFTVDHIAAGTYQYYCDQQGHRDSGMQGVLTVT